MQGHTLTQCTANQSLRRQTAVVVGQRVPLLDLDRQSLIVRLGGQDCRIRVWWQPSNESWFGSIEVPVNNPAKTARRLGVNTGLLDRLQDVLPGNVVCRAVDEDSGAHDPTRLAWARQTPWAVLGAEQLKKKPAGWRAWWFVFYFRYSVAMSMQVGQYPISSSISRPSTLIIVASTFLSVFCDSALSANCRAGCHSDVNCASGGF